VHSSFTATALPIALAPGSAKWLCGIVVMMLQYVELGQYRDG